MSRILFVVPRFHPNLFFATRALQQAGHQVHLFANRALGDEDHSHLTPHVFGAQPSFAEIRKAMAAIGPDLVFLRNAVGLNREAARAARKLNVPAWRYNQTAVTTPTPVWGQVQTWLKGLPQRRVTPVRGLDRTAPPAPNAHYLPWPVERLDPGTVPPPQDSRLRVLAVGRLGEPRKNHLALLQALDQAKLFDRVALTLVGAKPANLTGTRAAYFDQIQALAQPNQVEIRANVPYQQMASVYAAAQVCILPSTYETLGIAPVEAMAYGCVPVISTVSGAAGYVVPGENGLHVDHTRPETMADALGQLAEDRDLLDRLTQGTLATIADDLSAARFVERVEALL